MKAGQRLGLIGFAFVVALLHHALEWTTWASWDRALRPGEVRTMPMLWPIVSFPVFPLYDWLSGGDRSMFDSFEWVMLGNSAFWGGAAALIAFLVAGRRRPLP